MTLIYNLGIRLLYLFVIITSLFNTKAREWINGRKELLKKLADSIPDKDRIVWFHASSLGEFEQGRPLMEAFKKNMPEYKILLTFFSPSGYLIQKDYQGADYIFYLPLDTKRNAKKFLDIVKPEMTFFIKYEFWYHFLNQLKKSKSRVYLISSIFRQQQLFFKSYGQWYRNLLGCFDRIFVQDTKSIDLLMAISVENVTLSGDTRFDRVAQIADESAEIEIAERFTSDKFTYVCGSTWEKDEEIITKYINQNNKGCKFIIAPHEISESHIEVLLSRIDKKVVRYSKAKDELKEADVLIIDNIGMLSAIYRYGKVAYIGGGFGAGIHNILEAAVYSLPVVFGSNYEKFNEAVELINEGGAFSIASYEECKSKFDEMYSKKQIYDDASEATKNFVIRNLGATNTIIEYLRKS